MNEYAPRVDQEVLASLERPLARLVPVRLSVQDDREDRPIRRNLDRLSVQVGPEDPRNHPYPGIKISFVHTWLHYTSPSFSPFSIFVLENKANRK